MAVSYAPTKLRVPPGFQNLLEGLAREVLREQPDDILSFAAQYFKTQLAIREETGKDDAKKGSDMEKLMRGEEIDIDVSDPGLNEAATKIQASFRGHQTRQEIKQKKEEEQAATKIQASFRGHQTRKDLKKGEDNESKPETTDAEQVPEKPPETTTDEVDINLEDPEVQKAALTIQSSFRGHKAREEVKAMKSQTDITEEQPEETIKDQEESETQKESDETAEKEEAVDINLEDPEVQKAAVKIQASFRGHKAREDVKKIKSSEEVTQEKGDEPTDEPTVEVAEPTGEATEEKPSEEQVDIDLNDPDVAKAATTIQASFRGHKARKEMKEGQEDKVEESEEKEQEQEQEPEKGQEQEQES